MSCTVGTCANIMLLSCSSTCQTNPSSDNLYILLKQREEEMFPLVFWGAAKRQFLFCMLLVCSQRILFFFFFFCCQPDFKWTLLFFVTQAFIFNFWTLQHLSVWVTFLLFPLLLLLCRLTAIHFGINCLEIVFPQHPPGHLNLFLQFELALKGE